MTSSERAVARISDGLLFQCGPGQELRVSGRIALRKPTMACARDRKDTVLFSPFLSINTDRWITSGPACSTASPKMKHALA